MKKITLALALLLAGTTLTVTADNLDNGWKQRANDLLASRKFLEAYQLLSPIMDNQAGNPDYDYLFGQAALGVGHKTESVMAYERCLLVDPLHHHCRLGITQAYMALNENSNAQQELQQLKSAKLADNAAQMVEDYLSQLRGSQDSRGRTRYIGWLEISGGHDSNSNYAPDSSDIRLPASSNYPGYSYRTARDSTLFTRIKGRLGAQIPVSQRWDVFTGITAQSTQNQQTHTNSQFDKNSQLDAWLGTSYRLNKHRFGLMAQMQDYRLHSRHFRDMYALTAQYGYALSTRTRLDAYLQQARQSYRYRNHDGLQDLDSTLAGVTVTRYLPGKNRILFAGLYTGQDRKAQGKALKSIGSDYTGLRGGLSWSFNDNWQAGASVLLEQRHYLGRYSERYLGSFDKKRKDLRAVTELELAWYVLPRLSLRAQYSYTNNHSNINIRKYGRQTGSLGVRHEFF